MLVVDCGRLLFLVVLQVVHEWPTVEGSNRSPLKQPTVEYVLKIDLLFNMLAG